MGKSQKIKLVRKFEREDVHQSAVEPLNDLDKDALAIMRLARRQGRRVVLVGGDEARFLAKQMNLPWLHEMENPSKIPYAVAWNPNIAEAGGPLLSDWVVSRAIVVFGAGIRDWTHAERSNFPRLSEKIKDAQMRGWFLLAQEESDDDYLD
jgi:hypothetical protein